MQITNMLKRVLGMGPVVHPVDGGLAKRWIKARLLAVFPELRGNPRGLEQAYRQLSLEPREGDDKDVVFEIGCHREPEQ